MLPLVLSRLGFDPAASSAPFVATLVDVTGLLIFFSVAALILSRHPPVREATGTGVPAVPSGTATPSLPG
jgi:Divalent cation transporter